MLLTPIVHAGHTLHRSVDGPARVHASTLLTHRRRRGRAGPAAAAAIPRAARAFPLVRMPLVEGRASPRHRRGLQSPAIRPRHATQPRHPRPPHGRRPRHSHHPTDAGSARLSTLLTHPPDRGRFRRRCSGRDARPIAHDNTAIPRRRSQWPSALLTPQPSSAPWRGVHAAHTPAASWTPPPHRSPRPSPVHAAHTTPSRGRPGRAPPGPATVPAGRLSPIAARKRYPDGRPCHSHIHPAVDAPPPPPMGAGIRKGAGAGGILLAPAPLRPTLYALRPTPYAPRPTPRPPPAARCGRPTAPASPRTSPAAWSAARASSPPACPRRPACRAPSAASASPCAGSCS